MKGFLQLALQFRKESDILQALLHLTKACEEEKNPLALFYMADAYEYGGWGLERDLQKAFLYARRAHQAGCAYGTYMYEKKLGVSLPGGKKSPFIREGEPTSKMQTEAVNGDGFCQLLYSCHMVMKNQKMPDFFFKSIEQCVHQSYALAGLYYYARKKEYKKGIRYLNMCNDFETVINSIAESQDPKEYYAFGWASSKGIVIGAFYHTKYETMYFQTYERVTKALEAWFIIAKREGINKDMTRLIAKCLLEYAEDPDEWGVVLGEE